LEDREVVHFNQKKKPMMKKNLQKIKVCYILIFFTFLIIKSKCFMYILVAREIFEKRRKEHYNEFQTAKILAKQMMDEEDEDDNNKTNETSLV